MRQQKYQIGECVEVNFLDEFIDAIVKDFYETQDGYFQYILEHVPEWSNQIHQRYDADDLPTLVLQVPMEEVVTIHAVEDAKTASLYPMCGAYIYRKIETATTSRDRRAMYDEAHKTQNHLINHYNAVGSPQENAREQRIWDACRMSGRKTFALPVAPVVTIEKNKHDS